MKILVCVKQVAARDSALPVSADGRLETTDLRWEMNEPDAYALEEALQLRDKLGGEVTVISVGPERAGQTIREALAKGADRGVHVRLDEEPSVASDPLATAELLANAAREEQPELILTGLQSDDGGYGQTGVILAALLGMPSATIAVELEIADGRARVKRELESGWYQQVTLTLPAVVTIQSGIRRLRYATLMGIKKAKTKPVRVVEGRLAQGSFGLAGMHVPNRSKQTVILSGEPKQVAQELIEKLRFEARVL